MLSCTMSRRSVVQRWPAVPAAAKMMARVASSRSAVGVTIIALLPPSSSRQRPRRLATVWATAWPMRVEPVALISGSFRDAASAWPTSALPMTTLEHRRAGLRGISLEHFARRSCMQAIAVSGVFSDGFQTTGSPQTSASVAFHAQTATGKLNAVMTPTGPSGCHCSIMRWPGRSEAMVRP